MNKFKINDRVVIGRERNGGTFGIGDAHMGEKGTVVHVPDKKECNYRVETENGTRWHCKEEQLTLAAPTQKIVITTDGKETLARMYEDDKVIRRATAKCSPRDKFDFQTGAKIAFERLIGEAEKEPEPDPLNGKFVAVEQIPGFVPMTGVCVGKIVTFKDGYDISGNIPVRYDRIERTKVNGSYGGSLTNTGFRFIKVEEEEAKESEFLNGKFLCVEPIRELGQVSYVSPGHIYEIKDGRIIGVKHGRPFSSVEYPAKTVETLPLTATGYRFIEVKED